MRSARIPDNEAQRLDRLRSYQILDTPPEKAFDRITRIVAETIGVPIALVSLIDQDRQWFKSKYGLNADETPRDLAFCAHAILGNEVFVVKDAFADERFHDNPLVTQAPNVRFYAGAPLITSEGLKIGTLCAIDHVPHDLTVDHSLLLEDLASLVIDELELRTALRNAVEDMERQKDLKLEAQTASIVKSQFLASMSHEIRTPLNAIIGLTELVLKTEMSEHQRAHLDRVTLAGKNLLGLINDILDYSKIEAGKLEIENIDFDINTVILNVATIIGPKSEENRNELLISVSDEIPGTLLGDPLRLGQILINIIGNAVKFTQDGDIVVSVDTETDDTGNAWLSISVRDTGIGIPEDRQATLFDAFTQADQSITRTHGGTGLGLSITNTLINAMHGKIRLQSAPGVGSTFFIHLPLVAVPAPEKPRRVCNEAIRLLVVDDNGAARGLLEETLAKLQFDVDTASTAIDVTERMAQAADAGRPYDAVIMDRKMPDADGLVAFRKIRGSAHGKDVKLILMDSIFAMDEVMAEFEPLRIASWIQKPIITSMLFDSIMQGLGKAEAPILSLHGAKAVKQSFSFAGVKLLLVEDNELNQIVARGILEAADFEVIIADNGKIAIDVLKEFGEDYFSAVLMDIQMPEMDGLTATIHIRKNLGFVRVPVLAMTAHVLSDERNECLEAGMNAHVSKPIDAAELLTKIATMLDHHRDLRPAS